MHPGRIERPKIEKFYARCDRNVADENIAQLVLDFLNGLPGSVTKIVKVRD